MNDERLDITVDELTSHSDAASQPQHAKICLKPHQLTALYKCLEIERNKSVNISPAALETLGDTETCVTRKNNNLNITNHDVEHIITDIGIIGDRVGSGKSFTALGLVAKDMECTNIVGNQRTMTFGRNRISIRTKENVMNTKITVIVCPPNLEDQWVRYIERFFSDNITRFVLRSWSDIDELENNLHTVITNNDAKIMLITSKTAHNSVAEIFRTNNIKANRVVYDEIDTTKMTLDEFPGNFTWLMTASYINLLYPTGFYKWDIQSQSTITVAPGVKCTGYMKTVLLDLFKEAPVSVINALVVKNADAFVDEAFNVPAMSKFIVMCRSPSTLRVLNGIVDEKIIQFINAGDNRSALRHINPSHRISENNIIEILIETYTQNISNLELQFTATSQMCFGSNAERTSRLNVISCDIRDFKHKIHCIKERIKDTGSCCICYEKIQDKTVLTCCSNAYCFKCVQFWVHYNKTCPLCKQAVDNRKMYVVTNNEDPSGSGNTSGSGSGNNCESSCSSSNGHTTEQCELMDSMGLSDQKTKLENMQAIFNNITRSSRILVFSSQENTLIDVNAALLSSNISSSYLRGSSNSVKKILDRYTSGDIKVLLVNADNYGSGLNLEVTTDIVMFHKFNNSIEGQVIGRAQRNGRTEPLKIWHLLYETEL